jgi:DNA primase
MAEQWVSFQQIKDQVSIKDIVNHYGIQLRARKGGDELAGLCPFHGPGKSRDPFRVSLSKNNWHCFQCDRGGNVLDFVAQHEDVGIREAALTVQQWFGEHTDSVAAAAESSPEPVGPVNSPLTFELKNIDHKHPYLKERGLSAEVIKEFGLGHCSRGLMKDRIAIPIHNEQGQLVAYAGRWPSEDVPEDQEKYRVPPNFHKSLMLYNLHRAWEFATETGELIVVEGFFDALRIWQAGFHHVVALMGSQLYPAQTHLLQAVLGTKGRVTLMLDADEAGRACRSQCIEKLVPHLYVKAVELPEGAGQPDQLSDKQIRQLF